MDYKDIIDDSKALWVVTIIDIREWADREDHQLSHSSLFTDLESVELFIRERKADEGYDPEHEQIEVMRTWPNLHLPGLLDPPARTPTV